MKKIIVTEQQLGNMIQNLTTTDPNFLDDESSQDCMCNDYSMMYGCYDCELCCQDKGGHMVSDSEYAPIAGMGTVEYSYADPAEIATSNASSSFGYVPQR